MRESVRDAQEIHEIGAVRKSWKGRLSIALAFPNTYHVGMSNLGFQTVHRLFNHYEHVVCERVFSPRQGAPLSVESGRPLRDFDVIAFSLSFENDYLNILSLLEKGGVPVRSDSRSASHPLVVAGGVGCFLNPEPLAPFLDVSFLGEAEAVIPELAARLDPAAPREELLEALARHVPGAYVPGLYTPQYGADGVLEEFSPRKGFPSTISRAYVEDLDKHPACSSIIAKDTAFDQTHLVEVSRGCPHGCRFCCVGYVYRPVRFRSLEVLAQCLDEGRARSDQAGLMGAAVSDLPCLDALCAHGEAIGVHLSFSSFRADALSGALVQALARAKVKTATLAPEAGSQRMRGVIKKGITEDHILDAAQTLVDAGVPNIKLYFMVGLPTETARDVQAIVDLTKRIKHRFLKASRPKGRIGAISLSLNCFVPKPFTPFQWAAMDEVPVLKQKIKRVKQGLAKVANVNVTADVPRWAAIQALLARGDRRVADVLEGALKNKGNWPQTLKETPVNPAFYTTRLRDPDELFPWDFIDNHTPKSFLRKEYEKALNLS